MKIKAMKILIAVTAVTALALTGCDGAQIQEQPEPPAAEEQNEGTVPEDISAEYTLEYNAEYIIAGNDASLNIKTDSDRAVTVLWESSDTQVLTVSEGKVTGVAKGTATVSATISAEGCLDFTLSQEIEIKPADFELVPINNFVVITDLSAKDPEDADFVVFLLDGGRKLMTAAANNDYTMKKRTSSFEEQPYEILIGETSRVESLGIDEGLGENEFIIKSVKTENGMKLLLGAGNSHSRTMAFEKFTELLVRTDEGAFIPSDLDIREEALQIDYSNMFESENIFIVRDPCVVLHEETYYLYGTGLASGIGYGCVTSDDLRTWSEPFNVYTFPEEIGAKGDCWAPECHYYNGNYYLFATYRGSNDLRGCAIFKAATPAGPFEMITDGHLTSPDWHAIDATLYVDENGDPWIIYVREWVSAPNEIGTFEAARLSDDLTEIISEPVELFKANSSLWSTKGVTDGCWAYKMQSTGALVMLWSNWDGGGYCVGMATSESGSILGPWKQSTTRLYSATYSNGYDGGHGSIFTDKNGQLMMTFHGPNSSTDEVREHAFFLPIEEDAERNILVPKK